MTSRVLDVDRGIKALLKRMKQNNTQLSVGFPSDSGSHGRVSTLQIANWNHFGTARIPPRPFVEQWFDFNVLDNATIIYRLFQQVVEGKLSGVGQALNILGARFVAGIQKQIVTGSFAPNAPSTIRRKGSSKPLIDTGVMKSAVRFLVKGL